MAGRKPKVPPSPFSGMTLDQWREDSTFVTWARSDPTFNHVLAVVQNGFVTLPADEFEGYRHCVLQLLSLRTQAEKPKEQPPADYREPLEEFKDTAE